MAAVRPRRDDPVGMIYDDDDWPEAPSPDYVLRASDDPGARVEPLGHDTAEIRRAFEILAGLLGCDPDELVSTKVAHRPRTGETYHRDQLAKIVARLRDYEAPFEAIQKVIPRSLSTLSRLAHDGQLLLNPRVTWVRGRT
jgi:hypothetical protein